MYMLQLIFISVNFGFSFVLNSLTYITIQKDNGKILLLFKLRMCNTPLFMYIEWQITFEEARRWIVIKFYFPTSVPYWFFLTVEKTFTWLYSLEQNLSST